MLPIRRSQSAHPNDSLRKVTARRAQSNLALLRDAREATGIGQPGDVVLLGGSSLADFRVRIAQSHARHDMTPSYWSLVGIVVDTEALVSVPLWPLPDPAIVPSTNAIQRLDLAAFDDPERYPNVAVIRFPGASEPVIDVVDRLRTQRGVVDLPSMILAWLGFAWGAGGAPNPLLDGVGLPSAALVETAFGIAQVELTPGLASASSCPEAIWQAVKWWHRFYEDAAGVGEAGSQAGGARARASRAEARARAIPAGSFIIRQPEATYRVPA